MASEKTAVGMPEGRLQVRVGEIVRFRVESGNYQHGVLFEKAKSELEARVWEAVKDSEELKTVPDSFTAFDRNNVETTAPLGEFRHEPFFYPGTQSASRGRFDPQADLVKEAAMVIDAEHRCCRFLHFLLLVEPGDGPIWLEVTGPEGTPAFLSTLLDTAPARSSGR